MTIGELIQILNSHPSDTRVVVNGYEEGYDDLSPEQIAMVQVQLNTGVHKWQGRHGDPRDKPERSPDHADIVNALVLGRLSN